MKLKKGVWGLLLVCLFVAAPARALTAQQIKAAYLFNFFKLVQWPGGSFAGGSAPFVLALYGGDPFGGALDGFLKGKTVESRAITLVRINSPAEAKKAHLVFVAAARSGDMAKVSAAVKGAPVLVVGDGPGLTGKGAVLSLVEAGGKVKVCLDEAAASRAKLKVSPQLIVLAKQCGG